MERRLLTAGKTRVSGPVQPQTEQQRTYAQAMLNQIHQQFIAVVKAGQGRPTEDNA